MGECGCYQNGSFFKLPAPKGDTYVIQLQPPCNHCPGPAGIAVHRYSRQRMKDNPVDAAPLAFHDHGHGYADTGLVLLDMEALRGQLTKYLIKAKLAEDEFDGEEYAREMIDECIVPLLFEQPIAKPAAGDEPGERG